MTPLSFSTAPDYTFAYANIDVYPHKVTLPFISFSAFNAAVQTQATAQKMRSMLLCAADSGSKTQAHILTLTRNVPRNLAVGSFILSLLTEGSREAYQNYSAYKTGNKTATQAITNTVVDTLSSSMLSGAVTFISSSLLSKNIAKTMALGLVESTSSVILGVALAYFLTLGLQYAAYEFTNHVENL